MHAHHTSPGYLMWLFSTNIVLFLISCFSHIFLYFHKCGTLWSPLSQLLLGTMLGVTREIIPYEPLSKPTSPAGTHDFTPTLTLDMQRELNTVPVPPSRPMISKIFAEEYIVHHLRQLCTIVVICSDSWIQIVTSTMSRSGSLKPAMFYKMETAAVLAWCYFWIDFSMGFYWQAMASFKILFQKLSDPSRSQGTSPKSSIP